VKFGGATTQGIDGVEKGEFPSRRVRAPAELSGQIPARSDQARLRLQRHGRPGVILGLTERIDKADP
jgi:hypothetical protein